MFHHCSTQLNSHETYIISIDFRSGCAGQDEESDDAEVEGVDQDQSQQTVPATSPEVAAAKVAAQQQHEETLKAMEIENQKNHPAHTPSLGHAASDPVLGDPQKGTRPPATPMNKGGKSKKGKGPKARKTAVKSKANPKHSVKPRAGKPPKDDNPFDQPPDPDQARLTLGPNSLTVVQPPPVAPAEGNPDKPAPAAQPEKAPVARQTTMDAMDAMLNRPDTQEMDAASEGVSLGDMSTMLDKELEKKEKEEKKNGGKKEKTPEEKSRHARRMRFFRSLTSHSLSVFRSRVTINKEK